MRNLDPENITAIKCEEGCVPPTVVGEINFPKKICEAKLLQLVLQIYPHADSVSYTKGLNIIGTFYQSCFRSLKVQPRRRVTTFSAQ